jgi:predicted RNase H-like nuclease
MLFIGIDLAWGDRKPDGVCMISASHRTARMSGLAYPTGDKELLTLLREILSTSPSAFLTIDAPIVCPNTTGTRPVDRLTHTMFHREHAACHPANATKCPRPPRIRRKLEKMGVHTGWEIAPSQWMAAEVYPHPAMVRLFEIPRIVKYKRGTVAERRKEFARLQDLLSTLLEHRFPYLTLSEEARSLLQSPWSKRVEDLTDAFFCALIGLWHWKHHGKKSEILGNKRTGFILLPHLNKD